MNPNTIKNKVIVYCNKSINNSNSFYDSINNQYLSLSSYEILFKDKYYELPTTESRIEISSNIVPFDSPACFLSLKLNLTDNVCIMQIPGYVSVCYSYIYKKFTLLTRYGKVESRVLTEEELSKKINIYIDFMNCKFCINSCNLHSYPYYEGWTLDGGNNIRIGRGNWRSYYNAILNLYEFGFLNDTLTEEEVKYLFTSKSDIIKSSVKNAIVNNELFKKYCIPIEEE